jgi:hypothetical protein
MCISRVGCNLVDETRRHFLRQMSTALRLSVGEIDTGSSRMCVVEENKDVLIHLRASKPWSSAGENKRGPLPPPIHWPEKLRFYQDF